MLVHYPMGAHLSYIEYFYPVLTVCILKYRMYLSCDRDINNAAYSRLWNHTNSGPLMTILFYMVKGPAADATDAPQPFVQPYDEEQFLTKFYK